MNETSKITRYRDIPQLTRTGSHNINVGWGYLEQHLAGLDEPRGILNLDPDFQRHHVWTQEKQIAYVEYILRGGKSSRVLHLNCATWHGGDPPMPIELVDGKQRLQAVRLFLANEFPVFGSYHKEFTDNMRINGPDFIFSMNDLKTRQEVLQWYIDLNAGGVAHTSEEIEKVKTLLQEEKEKNF